MDSNITDDGYLENELYFWVLRLLGDHKAVDNRRSAPCRLPCRGSDSIAVLESGLVVVEGADELDFHLCQFVEHRTLEAVQMMEGDVEWEAMMHRYPYQMKQKEME